MTKIGLFLFIYSPSGTTTNVEDFWGMELGKEAIIKFPCFRPENVFIRSCCIKFVYQVLG